MRYGFMPLSAVYFLNAQIRGGGRHRIRPQVSPASPEPPPPTSTSPQPSSQRRPALGSRSFPSFSGRACPALSSDVTRRASAAAKQTLTHYPAPPFARPDCLSPAGRLGEAERVVGVRGRRENPWSSTLRLRPEGRRMGCLAAPALHFLSTQPQRSQTNASIGSDLSGHSLRRVRRRTGLQSFPQTI
jgi:hypothetical protein